MKMKIDLKNVVYVIFVLSVLLFLYSLLQDYLSDRTVVSLSDSKSVTFNDSIEVKPIPGRESIIESVKNTEVEKEYESEKIEKELDSYLDDAAPLQRVSYSDVKDEEPTYDYKNKYLDNEYPKDTMKGNSDNYSDSFSTYLTVPVSDENNFNDAYGKPVDGTQRTLDPDFEGDMELTYNQWFQGKKPRELIPDDSITNPKFSKELEYKQDYTALGEWSYQNETGMNTGSTGTDVSGYSSFHSGSSLFDNKVEVSKCHN
jgi:hypothetical protein